MRLSSGSAGTEELMTATLPVVSSTTAATDPRLGFFGLAITPRIAVATLVLHLVYGFTLGWLLDRKEK